jgi:exonuclease SbcD
MKILHFADLHLGVERFGHIDPQTGLSTRLQDFLTALDRIIDVAIAEQVDAILFAGDAYKNREPTPTIQRELARRLRRVVEAGIPTVILIGNHDLPNAWGRATAVEIFQALAVPNIHIANEIETIRLDTRSGPLQVVTLPWVTRAHVLSQEEIAKLSMEEAQERLQEAVAFHVREQADALDPAAPAILLAHITAQGATFGSERSAMLGTDLVFTRGDLAAHAFDYGALGHIHKHQAVGQEPPLVYAGSPERVDFGEENEPKGFVLVEIGAGARSERRLSWQFCQLPARRFRTLRLRAHGADPQGDLVRVLEGARDLDGAIVRLYVQVAREAEGQVRPHELRRALRTAGAAHVAQVTLEEEEEESRPVLPVAETSPLELLRLYLTARQVPAARVERLIELARPLLPADLADDRQSSGDGL